MSEKVIVVFTAKSVETCLGVGGTQSWALDRAHAKRCRYAVLCQNTRTDWGDGTAPHGAAFMVGRVKDVVPSTETEGRWLVTFDQYTLVNLPNVWQGWRNPVRYTTLEELGMSLEGTRFEQMPPRLEPSEAAEAPIGEPATILAGVRIAPEHAIAETRKFLATTFGVKPEAIEITIHG